ncbi:oxygen-independent coproporphyrinogen III oxidase [Deltaproteobacteria bacterium]|nr:oxygen-independent coproporphyrinogen III oxidase [Deltaproteobacteria bacterium]
MSTFTTPDPALVSRYRTRAPRYTSYPTAPQFAPIAAQELVAGLAAGTGPVSLYAHIPFCAKRCHYCGCHVEIHGNRDIGDRYVDGLLAEAALWARPMQAGRQMAQLALGGGTPTFLRPAQLTRLVDGLRALWPQAAGAELAIEVDPRTVTKEDLENVVAVGFTRVNLGVQDVDEGVLAAVNRPQPFHLVESAVATLRRAGLNQVGVDLVYGLPQQTDETFTRTIEAVAGLAPGRIALFQYAHVPWLKPAQKLLERFARPDAEGRTRMWKIAREKLGAAGYREIGMDHFALPDDELVASLEAGHLQRNFEGYTTHGGLDLLGLGVSAIGFFGGRYAQNRKDREGWEADIEAGRFPTERGFVLSDDDHLRRRVIMELFCNFGVRFAPAEADSLAAELARLAPFEADGLVVCTPGRVEVTELGRFFIRNVCATFDKYLEADDGKRRYSETA